MMPGLFVTPGRVAAVLAVAGLSVVAAWQTVRVSALQAELARAEAEAAEQVASYASAARAAADEYRRVEAARAASQQEIVHDAQAAADQARRDAATARAAAGSLRNAAARAAAACSGGAAFNSTAAAGSAPAAGPGLVLADVLGRADDAAGELAQALDAARVAGLACERAYDSLIIN